MTASDVSVVVAVRNGAAHLAEALDSVLLQEPAPREVIVVDDGSTDATGAVLAGYGTAVRVVGQPPKGLAAALNRGVAATRGTILGFCDADDRWVAGRLAAQLAALAEDPGLDLVGGLVAEFLSPDAGDLAGRVRVAVEPRRARLLQAVLVRRATVERVGPFDTSLRHGAGIDWMSRLDSADARLGWVDALVVLRRIHHGNMGHDTGRARADLLAVLRRDRRRRTATRADGAGA